MVESPDGIGVPLEAIERAVDGKTALVATSHVFFTSGAIQDIRAVAEIAHRRGALLLVDGYQAAGQIPVDVVASDVDFYCGGGLKWLLGGSGVAFLYARPTCWATSRPGRPDGSPIGSSSASTRARSRSTPMPGGSRPARPRCCRSTPSSAGST